MGNFLFGIPDYIDYTPSCTAEDADWPATFLKEYYHPRWPMLTTGTVESYIVLDMGSANVVPAVLLDDANFTSVFIQGHATDAWGAPSFSQEFTISQHPKNRRYNLYAALTAFNYRYMRIKIPAQDTVDDQPVFQLGNIFLIPAVLELGRNPSYGFWEKAGPPAPSENVFPDGSKERASHGSYIPYEAGFSWNRIKTSEQSVIWQINAIDRGKIVIFNKNLDEPTIAHACYIESPSLKATSVHPGIDQMAEFVLREII